MADIYFHTKYKGEKSPLQCFGLEQKKCKRLLLNIIVNKWERGGHTRMLAYICVFVMFCALLGLNVFSLMVAIQGSSFLSGMVSS